MRLTDRLQAAMFHASARYTVRYGEDLRFAGSDLPRPKRMQVPTRRGRVPVWCYTDPSWDEPPNGVYVHFHGGAWLMRYPHMDDFWCRYLVATAGVTVLNVDFQAGPYVQYPVAQEQCHDVAAAVAEAGGGFADVVPARPAVAVGGLSSGGGLAASVCLQARDAGTFDPVFQFLGVPALDLAREIDQSSSMISPELRKLVRRVYFPDVASRREPYASPLLADDLSGLPPAAVLTAELDSLRPDGDRYAKRLAEAGVAVWHDVTPSADHYFWSADLLRARETMGKVAEMVRSATRFDD